MSDESNFNMEINIYNKAAINPENSIFLPETLLSLGENFSTWLNVQNSKSNEKQKYKNHLDEILTKNLERLKNSGVSNWITINQVSGWTVYGAVAMSWCEGAELDQVWEYWEASGFPLLPRPEYERPARFINPEILPDTTSLTALSELAGNKTLPLCAMIVAMGDKPLEFDMSEAQLRSASPQIAAFLKEKMKKQGNVDADLIAHWSETIKGTEYEV